MNPTIKRYLISSITTFLTAFFLTLGLQLQNGGITATSFTISTALGIINIAGRAGFKAIVEAFAGQHADAPAA